MAGKRDKERDISTSSINWLEQLAAEVNVPVAPEGWYTLTQICARLNRDHQYVRKLLKDRHAERKNFRHITLLGKTIITAHYKL